VNSIMLNETKSPGSGRKEESRSDSRGDPVLFEFITGPTHVDTGESGETYDAEVFGWCPWIDRANASDYCDLCIYVASQYKQSEA
jgi:hypothetical protein